MDYGKQIQILLADDHPIVRNGLAAVLNTQADMVVVAQTSNGQEAIEQFRVYQPDVAIVDLRMPLMGGVEAIATLHAEFPQASFIMFTVYDGDEDIYQGFRAGAKAYLLKDTPCAEITEVIRTVYEGERYISTKVGEKLAARIEMPQLSARERQVLELMAKGMSNKQISTCMLVAEGTVKFHVNNLLSKLGVCDRTNAVITALKRGIIML
jgi:DNA-binding NarL/FixJ family response regulator